ncbi:FAD-binding protein [Sutterella seckii]|uniref:FAD-binding protein n=1 Tax=Sutterella seckii TaxID=1944635 RepID=UPI001D053352
MLRRPRRHEGCLRRARQRPRGEGTPRQGPERRRPHEGEARVGVGRGIAKEADLALADALAKAIGAEVGCSRPIAEGEHWMERERYIGVSGVLLKGDVYVALGISGQIQHMVGVNDCGTIIAVNKDKNAPIFNYCDYGIVGDIYKVLPELTKALS